LWSCSSCTNTPIGASPASGLSLNINEGRKIKDVKILDNNNSQGCMSAFSASLKSLIDCSVPLSTPSLR
jgi:hypothetical protein